MQEKKDSDLEKEHKVFCKNVMRIIKDDKIEATIDKEQKRFCEYVLKKRRMIK